MNSEIVTPPSIAKICVVIVNYGTADLTIKGVESVLSHTHGGRDVTVAVVDNASPDDSAAVLQKAWQDKDWGARVTLYLEDENHGFGRANNLVFAALADQAASPDAFFLLSPDAFLDNEAIDLLAQVLEAKPDVGFAGAGIAKPSGTAVTAAFRFPSVMSEIAAAINFGPISGRFADQAVPLPPDHPEGAVDWLAGAAVLLRRQTLEDIGFFDPRFFLYYEEVDLMHRAHDAGWQSYFAPHARVIHIEGEATGVKSGEQVARRVPAYRYDAWQYYFQKHNGRSKALTAAFGMILGSVLNRGISLLRRRPTSVAKGFFLDFPRHSLAPLMGLGRNG